MSFFVSLEACPNCGNRVDPEPLKIYGDNTAWSLAGDCKSCGKPVGFAFITSGDPIHAKHAYNELGEGHSELIPAHRFMRELETTMSKLDENPSRLPLAEWKRNRDLGNRSEICVVELAKFLEPGESEIAESRLTEEDRAYRRENPKRYTRGWIEEMVTRQKRIDDAIIADLPRINALESAAKKKQPQGVDWIERDALQAHEQWVERGKKGKGRLVVVGAEHEAMNIGRGVELSGAVFQNTKLPDVQLRDVKLHKAELTNTSMERGKLYGAELRGTRIAGGSFKDADLETAELLDAVIEGTDFSGAELHASEWKGAQAKNARFERTKFGDANLTGAVFTACDFRGTDFDADDPDPPPPTAARFDGCDLRESSWEGRDVAGAVFVNCKMAGVRGRPVNVDQAIIENADVSASDIRKAWS